MRETHSARQQSRTAAVRADAVRPDAVCADAVCAGPAGPSSRRARCSCAALGVSACLTATGQARPGGPQRSSRRFRYSCSGRGGWVGCRPTAARVRGLNQQEITDRGGNLQGAAPVRCLDTHDSGDAATARGGPSRIILAGLAVLASALFLGAIGAVAYVLSVAQSAPSLASRHPIVDGASSQVFAADGTRLGFIQSDELRSPIPWAQIPTNLANATVAIEDQRFYKDDGVDITGIFRAAVKDILHGQALQGGSTITMQLMRNLYLGGDERTFKQKITEAKLALEYEKHHSKRSILTSYLNSVPYGTVGGQTAIGVQAASRIFFDKPASQLDLEQAALLAGLPQAPSEYNPFLDPAAARQRRNEVLTKMAELHYISPARAAAAERAPLEVHRGDFYSQRNAKASSSNTSASS